MKQQEELHDFYYLLDAKNEGIIVTLRFYNVQANKTLEISDLDYKPHFFLPHPILDTDEEEIRKLNGETEIVRKHDIFTNKLRELTKVTVSTPKNVLKAGKTFETAWETEIEYTKSYIYDHNLIFGAPYTIADDRPVLIDTVSKDLQERFEDVFPGTKKVDQQKHREIKTWFNLLNQPIPQIQPNQLGVKEASSENIVRAFALSRIANIPVTEAIKSHRVSDWLRSIIHTYLRRNNILIPTSKELRRGLETHRVPGALTATPKAGIYFNTVVCDFESLYPSCIDSYNLSYETVNCPHEECEKNRIQECLEYWVCTKRRGFYSILVGALKDLRIYHFKLLSKSNKTSERERRDAQVLAELLKLISVSSYGVTVRIQGLACPPLAECITCYGRWVLQTTWNLAEENGLQPIYGDTDSIFLDNPPEEWVEQLIETVKEKLKLDLAKEKDYSLCVLPSAKKAYFGILRNGKPDVKGLTAIKSNAPQFIQKVFRECVEELSNVKTVEEFDLAKKRIVAVVQRGVKKLRNRRVQLEDLVHSVKLYYDPKERLETGAAVTPQPYQCAIQLLDAGENVARGDTVDFIKVTPFTYKGKKFTVKPAEHVESEMEINVEDYVRNMSTALEQTFSPMGIRLEQKTETKISDWFTD